MQRLLFCLFGGVAVLLTACGGDGGQAAPGDDQVLVALMLEVDQDSLSQAALDVAEPNGDKAGQFLSLADIASSYGADEDTISAAIGSLKSLGVTVEADPTEAVLWD